MYHADQEGLFHCSVASQDFNYLDRVDRRILILLIMDGRLLQRNVKRGVAMVVMRIALAIDLQMVTFTVQPEA